MSWLLQQERRCPAALAVTASALLLGITHAMHPTPPLQIVLLGVCCSAGPGGGGDECEELALQPLPLYSVPADGVTMVAVAPTADGRIFLGGAGA